MIASDPFGSLVLFKMDDCIVFIDGAYLSLVSKYIGNGKHLKFDIKKFTEDIAKCQNLIYKEILYYNCPPFQGEPPTQEEERRKAGYDKFIIKLKKSGIIVREGRCQMINQAYCQKGVDVLLSIDLVRRAIKSNIKNFSSSSSSSLEENSFTLSSIIVESDAFPL